MFQVGAGAGIFVLAGAGLIFYSGAGEKSSGSRTLIK